ncbi:MAG: DUF2029 domain-containing protein [Chloroflexi bacterium]|nr:DUF2029 domain-containing protein [Chloroflexota bacterium]
MKKFWLFAIILLCAIIFLVGAIKISEIIEYQNSDFFQFWLGSRNIWDGGDPYNSAEWVQAHKEFGTDRIASPAYLYPLPLAILLSPLGLLPLKTAFITWTFLSESLLIISILLLLKSTDFNKTKHLILPIILANIIFRPTTTNFLGGQLSSLYLFITTVAATLWHKEKWFWGGATIALLAIKPSVGFPLLLILIPWILSRKKHTALAGIASTGLFLLISSLIKDPLWIPKYINILSTKLNNEFGNSPTIWGSSAMACNFDKACTAWLGSIFLLLFLLLNIWLLAKWRFSSPILALGHLISVGLLTTLYLWPYDHLLLTISIVFTMAYLLQKGANFIKVSLIFLSISIASVLIRVATILIHLEKETLYGLLPLLVWGLTTWMLTKENKSDSPHTPI